MYRRDFLATATVGTVGVVAGCLGDDDRLQWRFDTDHNVAGEPTVVDGVVYVGTHGGKIHAIDAEKGTEVWDHPASLGEADAHGSVRSAVSIAGDTIYVGSSALQRAVFALEADDGTMAWDEPFGTAGDSGVRQPPTLGDEAVVAVDRGNVYAINRSTGTLAWETPAEPPAQVRSPPAVDDDTAYVATDAGVVAYDLDTGQPLWGEEEPAGGTTFGSAPVLSGLTLYVGGYYGAVWAIDASTGELAWDEPFDSADWGDAYGSFVTVTAVDGVVYAANDDALFALDADSGELLWDEPVRPPEGAARFLGSPTVVDDQVLLVSSHGLYAVATDTGESLTGAPIDADAVLDGSPTVVDGVAYVGTAGPAIVAVETDAEGSSVCARVEHGLLGHHDTFAEKRG